MPFVSYEPNHYSSNGLVYEFLCFYRWHVFRRLLEKWPLLYPTEVPILKIMTLDSDVIMLENANEFYNKAISTLHYDRDSSYNYDIADLQNGAVHLWSSEGLITYSDFIYSFYTNGTKANIRNVLISHGVGMLFGELHFSDMQMVEIFSNLNRTTRNLCFTGPSLSTPISR